LLSITIVSLESEVHQLSDGRLYLRQLSPTLAWGEGAEGVGGVYVVLEGGHVGDLLVRRRSQNKKTFIPVTLALQSTTAMI